LSLEGTLIIRLFYINYKFYLESSIMPQKEALVLLGTFGLLQEVELPAKSLKFSLKYSQATIRPGFCY
jgi:hypothetical protein